MTRARDRWLAFGGMVLVLALAGLIVATVLDAQTNGRRSLERLQLAQVQQLAGTIDGAVVSGFTAEAGTVGIPPPWNLVPNDPADAARLSRLQSPAAKTGSILVDRNGVITNGTLLQGARVGDRLQRPELEKALGDHAVPAVLPVAPGVTTALPTIALAYPLRDGAGRPAGAYVTETDVSAESAFNMVIKPLGRGRTGQFSFIDDRGTVLASSNLSLLDAPATRMGLSLHEPPGFKRSHGQVAAVAAVPHAGWTAVFRQKASEFEGGLTGPLRSALLLLALAAIVAGGLAFVLLLRRLRAAREEQRRLLELNAVREEFMSIVSHELRTPVTGLLGFLQTTLDHWDAMSENDRRSALARAATNARRLHALTRDVLDTASIEAGELSYAFEVIDLGAEVASAAIAAQDLQPSRHMSVSAPDGRVWVRADPERLQQVLTNLLDNATKNSPSESSVEMVVTTSDDLVEVAVTDHGAGIPAEELAHVFDKFVRGRADAVRGTGLGLYICRRVVEAHGGRIWAVSSIGEGTTLKFTLPLAPAPAEPLRT